MNMGGHVSDYSAIIGVIEKEPTSPYSIVGQGTDASGGEFILNGILGAGPSADSFFNRLYQNHVIPKPMFSISGKSEKQDQGKLVLGAIGELANMDHIVYTNMADLTRWRVDIPNIQLLKDGSFIDVQLNEAGGGIAFDVDTGAQYTTAPHTMISSLVKAMGVSDIEVTEGEYYKVDCNLQQSSDSIIIYLASPIDINTGKPESYLNIPVSRLMSGPGSSCHIALTATDDNKAFTFGNDELLEQYIKIFDFGTTPRIGFAAYKTL